MSILKERVDYKYLEEELHQALRDDELYQLQNDAKIRAVEQRVPTYNDFREMVNAAHLKPLDRNDIKNRIPKQLNSFADKPEDWTFDSPIFKSSEAVKSFPMNDNYPKTVPKDTKEFMCTWKKIVDPKSKLEYLINARVHLGKRIFPIEVPSDFFEEVIDLCSCQSLNDKTEEVIDLFIKLSHCKRFELNLTFLTIEKKDILKKLLEELISTGVNESKELLEKYKMILK